MVECPVSKKHLLIKSTDNNDRFDTYYCRNCSIHLYDAHTHDYVKNTTVQLHKDYELMDIQEDITDEQQLEDLMCSETQRLFNR
jgi:hypothetical protein|tara:strand:- start:569 stop:820 length:252 start_codon:yes stop_codon:yes gene_type:complete